MKKFNFIYMLLAFVGVLSMTSCEHKYADYTPGPQDKNMGVYFPSIDVLEVAADATSVDILIARNNAEQAAEVSLRAEDIESTELFTVPSSVSFAAGETETTLTIDFNDALEVGKTYSLRLQLDQSEASQYAISEYVFSIIIPEPWEDWGTGSYVDDFYCALMAAAGSDIPAGYVAPVPFQKHGENENRIRVVNPASMQMFSNLWGGVPGILSYPTDAGDTYLEFDITDPDDVKIAPCDSLVEFVYEGYTYNAFMLGISMPANGYYLAFSWDPVEKFVLKDGIIKFPAQGIALSAFTTQGYLGDFDAANQMGYLQYYLPGTSFVNYDMTVEYGGMKVEADNATTSVVLNFGFGGNVEAFKFAVVDGNITDATAIVEAIVAGSEEIAIYEGSTDTYEYTVPVEGTGMKTVVAVPYAEGEAKTDYAVVYAFYFPGMGGGELPQVDITVAIDSVVGITGNPAYEESYPSDSTMCIYMEANAEELTAIKGFVGTGVPAEVTPEEVFAQGGEDFSDFIAEMAENGYALAVYTGLTPGTTYNVFLGFTTIYGETKYFREQYTPGAAAEQTGMRLSAKAPAYNVLDLAPATLR